MTCEPERSPPVRHRQRPRPRQAAECEPTRLAWSPLSSLGLVTLVRPYELESVIGADLVRLSEVELSLVPSSSPSPAGFAIHWSRPRIQYACLFGSPSLSIAAERVADVFAVVNHVGSLPACLVDELSSRTGTEPSDRPAWKRSFQAATRRRSLSIHTVNRLRSPSSNIRLRACLPFKADLGTKSGACSRCQCRGRLAEDLRRC